MQRTLKALSIRQPWATYSVRWRIGEVRSRRTHYRGLLVIRAAQKDDQEFRETLRNQDVSRGALIGIARLANCRRVPSERAWRKLRRRLGEKGPRPYGTRTFVWFLEDRREFVRPIPWKGRLGFFDVSYAIIRKAKCTAKLKTRHKSGSCRTFLLRP